MRRRRALPLLLSAVWLPYLVVQCPSCPGASTLLVRCASAANPVSAEPGVLHHHASHAPGEHSQSDHSGAGHHRHTPGGDCCGYLGNRTVTLASPIVLAAPAAALLPWSATTLNDSLRPQLSELVPIEPHQNSPPAYLAHHVLIL